MMIDNSTIAKIEAALQPLNALEFSDRIANHMHSLGIKGKRYNGCFCPVFLFLRDFANIPDLYGVGETFVNYLEGQIVRGYLLMNDEPIVAFIRDFDLGYYPKLEMNDADCSKE